MDINELLDYAIKEVSYIQKNEVFTLKDLFKGYEWNRINQGNRRKLGTLFLNFAQSQAYIAVKENNKGQKIYIIKP